MTLEEELEHERSIGFFVLRLRQDQPVLLEQLLIWKPDQMPYLLDHSPHRPIEPDRHGATDFV